MAENSRRHACGGAGIADCRTRHGAPVQNMSAARVGPATGIGTAGEEHHRQPQLGISVLGALDGLLYFVNGGGQLLPLGVFQQQAAAVARADAVAGEVQNVIATRLGAQTASEDFQLRFVFKIGGDAPSGCWVVDLVLGKS